MTGDGTAIAGGNTVSVSNNTNTSSAVHGSKALLSAGGSATTNDNTVSVTGGSHNTVRGGMASLTTGGTATAKGNTVTLSGVTITGGWVGAGDASTEETATGNATLSATENTMTMDGGSANTMSAGFCFNYANGSAEASDNDLILKNNARVTTTVVAGHAYAKNGNTTANKNTLTSTEGTGGNYEDTVNGGRARTENGSATAQENTGTLTSVTVGGDFMGGLAEATTGATAYKNEFTLDKGSYALKVQGGRAYTTGGEASATYNKLTITNNATFDGTINAGSAETTGTKATSTNNTVEALSGVTLKARIRVGEAISTATAYSSNNTANIKGGTSASYVVGGYANLKGDTATYAEAKENVVTVDGLGGKVKGFFGGEIQIAGSGNGLVEHNTGTLTNITTCTKVAGGNIYNQSGTITATRNEFTILKGTYTYLYGAIAEVKTGKDNVQDVAKVTSNIIDMTEGAVTGSAFGGRADIQKETTGADTATASSNTLNLNKTSTGEASWLLGGYATVAGTGSATASGNKGSWTDVTYTKDADTGLAGGGLASVKSGSATASTNVFSLTGGSYSIFVGGKAEITAGSSAETDVALAESNKFSLTKGTSSKEFTGGIALVSGTGKAQAKGNEVELTESESKTVTGASASADGGSSYAYKNTVTIKGGTFSDVCGGSSATETGTALSEANKVILTGGTYTNLVGGRAKLLSADTNDASGQSDETALLLTTADTPAVVSADDVAADEGVMLLADEDVPAVASEITSLGAEASGGTGTVTGNEVYVTDGTVTGLTIGGLATADASGIAKALSNTVRLKETAEGKASYSGTVYGARAKVDGNGTAEASEASTIELDSGNFTDIYGGSAEVAGKGTATATKQVYAFDFTTVQYSGSLIAGNASVGKGKAEASSNSFTLSGVYKGSVTAGKAAVNNAESAEDSASATGNKVTATDTAVSGDLHAGFAYVDGAGTATVSGNEMYLYGGQYDSNVSAGYIQATDETISATATDNTMVLGLGSDGTSSPVFNAQNSVLYGGYATTDGTTSIYANASNNTMRYEYVKGMTAANIKGFENFEFTLPSICADETVMTLTGGANGETTSIANATIKATVGNVYGNTGGALQIGDRIYLLKNANGLDSTGATLLPVEYTTGVVISHKGVLTAEGLLLKTDGNSLYLTTPDFGSTNSGAKAISEGGAAGLALASAAADTVIETVRALDRQEWFVFGRINGGKSRYETGSSIEMTTLSMIAGLGKGINTDAGFLTVGAFLEYGTGAYTTRNSFAGRSDIDGDGQSRYMGGGILAKMDFKDTGPGHFYADATAHMGNLHNAFDSNEITDNSGRTTTFDYDTPYYSVHGSLGYKWDITDSHELDMYGQYIWTKVEGANVDLSTGDVYKFDDMNSNRLRFGATYSYKGHPMFSPYIGAAWEHEFSGRCEAITSGFDVASPSFRGDTLRGELGIKTVESEDMPVTLNLGVQGFTGVRNGVSGNFYFRYDF